MQQYQKPPVFRFAPSPNGHLHLGHVYSVLLNEKLARQAGGKLLLRIENVDRQRSKPAFETAIIDDLNWLGIAFSDKPSRQSDNLEAYQAALNGLSAKGFAYKSTVSRSEIAAMAGRDSNWPRDPDGAWLPPETEHGKPISPDGYAIRLDMKAALAACPADLHWREAAMAIRCEPNVWGNVVLKSRDGSFAYHLAVVVDDAAQNITHIVRGRDLYAATSIHRVLQALLALPEPDYLHHDLILDADGGKLAKSRNSETLRSLRGQGITPNQLRQMLGFSA